MKAFNIWGTLLVFVLITGCGSKEPAISTYTFYTYDAECLGNNNGLQTILAWGTGKSEREAANAAVRNAVLAVMFKGVHKGIGNCNIKPLINKADAETAYQDYFNRLMSTGSLYKKFVKDVEDHKASKAHDNLYKVGRIVQINIPVLRQQLIDDGILSATN